MEITKEERELLEERRKIRESLQKEIFDECKRGDRPLNAFEIGFLLNLEEQGFFETLTPTLNKWIKERHKEVHKQ